MSRSYQSTLTRKGQATIPVELQEEYGLQEGDKLIWSSEKGQIAVTTSQAVVKRRAGIFKDRIPPFPSGGIEQRMAEEKETAESGWTERWERFAPENPE